MGMPGPTELIIIAVVVMLLFGAKKMPDAARSLGRSMRIFKAETKGLQDDDDGKDKKSSEQSKATAEPQQLKTTGNDTPVVDGKVVGREQARQQSH